MMFSDICNAMKEEVVIANQRIESLVSREEDFQEILRCVVKLLSNDAPMGPI